MLLFFGTGGASALAPITTNHAVAFDLADYNVAVDTITNTFINTFSDGRAAWEIRQLTEPTTVANTIDTTHWGTTTQLRQNDIVLPTSPVEIIDDAVFVANETVSESKASHAIPIQTIDLTQQYVTSRQAAGTTDVTLSLIIAGALLE
ncbi:MAG: hypothetical protein KBC15_00865 [Candidatus Levybacteria bacterium]|nr:hypothetical protein [Candidatus Levybacteria bacterium]